MFRHGSLALFLLAVATTAHAAWPTTSSPNVPVSADPARDALGQIGVPDSCGGMIVGWVDVGPSVTTIDVQRMDAFGQARWTLNGFPVTPPTGGGGSFDLAPDDAGGAYVVWVARRITGNGFDLYLQHVLSTGVLDPVWPPAGVPVCETTGDQNYPRIVRDGSGGALIAWEDSRGNVDFAPDVYAQRVSGTGTAMWAANGVPVIVLVQQQFSPKIAPDGAGGLFVGWIDQRAPGEDIYAQHLEPVAGARTWGVNGLPVCSAPGPQSGLDVASENGRFFLAWVDGRIAGIEPIYAQAVDISGSTLWAPDGVQVSSPAEPNNNSAQVVPDALGGAIIGWQAFDSGGSDDDIHAQRVNAAGTLAWTGSVTLCGAPGRQLFMDGVSDQRGGAIFAWDDRRVSESAIDIFARRVDSAGNALWAADGSIVSSATGNQVAPIAVTDGAGGAVLAWQDQRNSPDVDIYSAEIGASGSLGVRAASKNCAPDFCGYAYTDFGDAPEGIPAFPSGAPGHYPTCTADSQPGTQEVACGTAPSTPPGPTGYVEHVAGWSDAAYFGFGCGGNPAMLSVTTETDGIEKFGPLPGVIPSEVSACSPGAAIYEYDSGSFGLYWGADEVAGDAGAGLSAPPSLHACQPGWLTYAAFACAGQEITVYLNVLVDWNFDGDWNDVVQCEGSPPGCVPEWAVKNVPVKLKPGCNTLDTPFFPTGPNLGRTWLRMTLTGSPVSDDFPWRGSAPAVRGDPGFFAGGETEDYPVSIIQATGVDDAAPAALRLEVPTPNPTVGAAALHFALPRSMHAEIGVFDAAGRRVRTLLAGTVSAGEHTTSWDGLDAAGARARAGLYFVRLFANGVARSRCLVLAR